MLHRVKETSDIGVEYPVHAFAHQSDPERIQCVMRAEPWAKPIRESQEVLPVNLIEDRPDRVLDYFVIHGGEAQRPLSPVRLQEV